MKNFSKIESLKASRPWSFAVITIIYLIAAALGLWTFLALSRRDKNDAQKVRMLF